MIYLAMRSFRYLLLGLILLFSSSVSAQSYQIKGTVIDKIQRETLPFCNIFIPQLKEGFVANEDGEFSLTLTKKVDSITFTYLGYQPYVLRFPIPQNEDIMIEMEEISNELEQVVIVAPRRRQRDSTAWRIYRNVVDNKPLNKPTAHTFFEYEEYDKMVGSFYNFSPKLLNRRLIRPFKFVLENYDTTSDGRLFIPLILKEEITHHYYQKEPEKKKRVTMSQKISGVEQAQIGNLMNIALDNMDAYSNELLISGKSFMLPFADGAWFKYRFYVIDSTENDDCEWVYHIGFSPAIKGELAFLGEAWIHAPTYAIQKIQLKLDKGVNFNWVNDFSAEQEFTYVDKKHWVITRDRRTNGISMTQRKKSKMVHLEQVKLYSKFRIDEAIADSIFSSKRLYAENYRKMPDEYWAENRHEPLSRSQSNVYFLIDSLKTTKAYKRYMNFGRTLITGFYKAGPVDIGSLYSILSFNPIEGIRPKLTIRSNRDMSEKFWYMIYGAYGTKDKRFKYGGELRYRIPNENLLFNEVGLRYKDDYQRFTLANVGSNDHDYILNALLRKNGFDDLVYVKDLSLYNNKEWNSTFTTTISAHYKQYQTIPGVMEFTTTKPDGTKEIVSKFKMFNPEFILEITPGANFIRTESKRILLKSKLPRITLNYTFSKKGILGSDFNFQSLGLRIQQRLPSPIGKTRYVFTANKLFGEIPYPLLYIHQGNENFLFDYKRFSNMREGEFAADQEISLMLEHNFEGFFLNKIPLIKKLKLREVFLFKMAYSSLDKKKTAFLDMPHTLKGLNGFYSEIGFGVDNILKMLQVQCSWRMTQKDHPDANNFVIKFWVSPNF